MMGNIVEYDQSENTVKFYFGATDPGLTVNEKIRALGLFDASATDTTNSNFFNGREFTVIRAAQDAGNKYFVECSTSGMNFPDADFNIAATNNDGKIYSELSTSVEAFFKVQTMYLRVQM